MMTLTKTRRTFYLIVMGFLGAVLLFMKPNGNTPATVMASWALAEIFEDMPAGMPEASDRSLSVASDYKQYLPVAQHGYESPFSSPFGVQLYGGITESRTALELLTRGRAHWARWPLGWDRIEPTNRAPADYDWSAYDASIRKAYESNLELIVTVGYNPGWAATYSNGPIDKVDISEFAQFITALVERYDGDGFQDAPGSPRVRYWELYNEPDAGVELNAADYGASYWGPFGNQYAQMLCVIYPQIKAADPHAQVVFGGIAYDHFIDGQGGGGFVREFLGDVLKAGGGNCFDVMNFHYYPPFEANWAAYGPGLSGKATFLRQNYDLGGKPMVVTEAGWHSEDYSIYPSSPQMQARYVIQLFTQAMYSNIQALTWWTWVDPDGGYGPNGLLTREFVPKPAYTTFRDAARRLGTATLSAKVYPDNPNIEVYRFVSARQQPLYVFWSRDGKSYSISLPLPKAQIVNMYGTILGEIVDGSDGRVDGYITVSAGIDPLYLEALP